MVSQLVKYYFWNDLSDMLQIIPVHNVAIKQMSVNVISKAWQDFQDFRHTDSEVCFYSIIKILLRK